MRCSKCGSDNRKGRKFCANCGAPLTITCPKCGASNEAGENFCGDCGAGLPPAAAKPPQVTPVVATSGERRHLTVLFCDLVGSTEIAAHLDPEEWRELVAAYHRAAAEAITRFGGHVAKYLGDGVMAFFGYPEAHDNDAERAVRAGLALLDTVLKLNQETSPASPSLMSKNRGRDKPKLAARVGIDSGAVVVGVGAGKEADVFGEAPNIAARVQAAAEPGTVLITDAVHQLVSGLFVVDNRGDSLLKGLERPLKLYKIIQPTGARGRLEAAAARGLTPFTGRDSELRLLGERWEQARDGDGQVVLIIGEAGIGKSRLVHRFHETLASQPYLWVDAAAGALFQNSPFYPVTEMLRRALFAGGSGPPDAIAQMAGALSHAGVDPSSAVPLLAPLLNLTLTSDYPPASLPLEHQRRKLLAVLVEWILGMARHQPLIILLEDLHWADPSTLELLQILVEQSNAAPLFLLFTARPEFHQSWPLRAHHAQLTLNRLGSIDIRAMIAQVAAQKALTNETVAAVIERTGGVPLFVEELTRAVLESGEGRLIGRAIPATLHDSLMARLDKLGPARETLQTGAVLGSEFNYDLLQAVHQLEDIELQRRLRTLTDAELLYVRGIAPDATYQFKHALIRDAAYEALLKSRRKELHHLVAETIDIKFPTIKETHPEILAQHWTDAGEIENAIAAWLTAANYSEGRRAFHEAHHNYRSALGLMKQLPESPSRDTRELDLTSALVRVLQVTRGYAASETKEAAERAAILAEKSNNLAELVLNLFPTWRRVLVAGDYISAEILADRLLCLAERDRSANCLWHGYYAQLQVCLMRGKLIEAEKHFASMTTISDTVTEKLFPGATVLSFSQASVGVWVMGYPHSATERIEYASAFARESGDPFNLGLAYLFESWLFRLARDPIGAETPAVQALSIADAQGFPYIRDHARSILGWARAELGNPSEGISLIRFGLMGLNESESRLGFSDILSRLAEAEACGGMIEKALNTITDALQVNPEEMLWQPNALIFRGRLHLELGETNLASADYGEAIKLAQRMNAKFWELRATTSLARLLRDTNRRTEAYSMLTNIYKWFTEGLDTADLRDAKALLDEFSA
jgi:class 3 adenylate cyclase/tetratricopeptide (TPR) repeat protein